MDKIIGREEEKRMLRIAIQSNMPELIAIVGRRRVGKTYLVREFLHKELAFELTGTKEASLADHLRNFSKALGKAAGKPHLYKIPANWSDAFDQLSSFLENRLKKSKTVVFFDEFPWLHSHKSGFLPAFDYWWNSWGNKQPTLKVIICGSAASWMIQNVVRSKGGLHNRITRNIRLLPFDLPETAAFLKSLKIKLEKYQIIQLYMVMGGIPHYLKEIQTGQSTEQAIDQICFRKSGLLYNEFDSLYRSLFDNETLHISVVKALARNNMGMTRSQIIQQTGLPSGGWISGLLDELIESGFVQGWPSYEKKTRDAIYKLSDEFTHFYLKFMEKRQRTGVGTWDHFASSPAWKSWSGFAFERICLKHIEQIKKALGIAGVNTEASAWRFLPTAKTDKGVQIDLLLDRRDFVINICEMKFSESEFVIDKSYAAALELKRKVFRKVTGTRKSTFLTMITSFGIKKNEYAINHIQNSITMKDLFVK